MRRKASDVLARARLGQDVVADKRAVAGKRTVTLGELAPKYLAAREGQLRPKSHSEVTRYLNHAWKPLHGHSIDAITRQHIVGVVDDLEGSSGQVAADRARTALSAFFGWAIDRGYLDANPTLNIRSRAQAGARDRVLSEREVIAIWEACRDDDHGRILRLLILTGQRRSEIGDMEWPEIDLRKRQLNLPAQRTKNGLAHIVPLSDEALAIIKSIAARPGRALVFGGGALGFGAWSKAKAKLDDRLPKTMPPWVLHDIRRSFVTHVSERGFAPPHVVEAIVNHVSGHKGGVAGVYNRAAYAAEKRQALELWGAHVAALMAGSATNIIPLRGQQNGGIVAQQ
jgi:integrase